MPPKYSQLNLPIYDTNRKAIVPLFSTGPVPPMAQSPATIPHKTPTDQPNPFSGNSSYTNFLNPLGLPPASFGAPQPAQAAAPQPNQKPSFGFLNRAANQAMQKYTRGQLAPNPFLNNFNFASGQGLPASNQPIVGGYQPTNQLANVGMGGRAGASYSLTGAVTGYTNPNFDGSIAQQRMMEIGRQADLERMRVAGASIKDRLAEEQRQKYYNFVTQSALAKSKAAEQEGVRQQKMFGESGVGYQRQAEKYAREAEDWQRKFGGARTAPQEQQQQRGPMTPTWSSVLASPLGGGYGEKERARLLYSMSPNATPFDFGFAKTAGFKPSAKQPYQPTTEEKSYETRRNRENAAALAKAESKRKKTEPNYPLREKIRRDVYKEFGLPI